MNHQSESAITQMPTPGLDDITPESAAQEIRGAIYKTRATLQRALDANDGAAIHYARNKLADLLQRAREENIDLEDTE